MEYISTKEQDIEAVEYFVEWLIENETLYNSWWFEGWIKQMLDYWKLIQSSTKVKT